MADYNPAIDSNNALISLEHAKEIIGIKINDESQERMAIFCVNAASELCNTLTGRLLKSRNNTEYYDGDGTDTIIVNNYPITTLSHVYMDSMQVFGADTDYVSGMRVVSEDMKNTIVYYQGQFLPGVRNLKVEYTGGLLTIPADLQMACMELTAFTWVQYHERRFGITSRSMGDGSATFYGQDIPKRILQILERYKGA